jgi:hypothetical protein
MEESSPSLGPAPPFEPAHASGGFLRPSTAPSPHPASPSVAALSTPGRPLPTPTKKSLNARAISSLIRYLDNALLETSRLHIQRAEGGGYRSVSALVEDLEKLVDLLWKSSTPSLQIQYLLQIANTFNEYLAGYQIADEKEWHDVFALLDKLDRCFHELLTAHATDTTGMNMTEKVRLKSVIERTRLHVVKLSELGDDRETPDPLTESVKDFERREREEEGPSTPEDVMDVKHEGEDGDGENFAWELDVARVYERTLQEIGDDLTTEIL